MAYVTVAEARSAARSEWTTKSMVASALRKSADAPMSTEYDVFLSHSYEDAELIGGLRVILGREELSVYVDWIEDAQADRSKVTPATADMLRQRMAHCRHLIYASSTAASSSKWISGTITVNGADIMSQSPVELRRHIGYVIQQVGLFPHLTVADNVATVPRLLGWERSKVTARVNELLELVGLPPATYAKRYPAELSGGQRQRAGVARALGADPPVLLMDEPFGAIDPITRDRLQGEFLRLQSEVRKTVVFVTHDIEEAVRLGDRIAILAQGGHLQQYDTPAKILGNPATPFVADFVGADRGLRRLTVTAIDIADLDRPPLVHLDDNLVEVRRAMDQAASKWAVVVDADGQLRGWIGRDRANGEGTVAERTHRMEAWVPLGASLKQAFSEMLQHDAGWVAVLDGARFVGVLTPDSLHAALRRSVDDEAGVDLQESPLRL